jgi:hypothetical protein
MMKLLGIVALVSVVIAATVVITKHSDGILAAFTSRADSSPTTLPSPTPLPRRVSFRDITVNFENRIGDVTPQGVFIKAFYKLVNVTDSDVYISESDIALVTEDDQRYGQSEEGLLAYAKGNKSELFDKRRVTPFGMLPSIAIFDVPLTGFRRSLQIQFRDDPTWPLPSPSLR